MNNTTVTRFPPSENFTPALALEFVLGLCKEGKITDVLIVGYDSDNDLVTYSSRMTRAEAVFLLEKGKEWAMYGGIE